MKHCDPLSCIFGGFALGMVAAIVIIVLFNEPAAEIKKQAVERGYAKWTVTNNETGGTKFTWVEPEPTDD